MLTLLFFNNGFLIGILLAVILNILLIHLVVLFLIDDDEILQSLNKKMFWNLGFHFKWLKDKQRLFFHHQSPSSSGPSLWNEIKGNELLKGTVRPITADYPIESCKWLNAIIHMLYHNLKAWKKEDIWTNYLNELLSSDEEKRRLISRLKINKLTLGNLAPQLAHLKLLPMESKKNEMILASKLIFVGSINVSLQAQLHLGVSYVDVDLSVSLTEVLSNFLFCYSAGKGNGLSFYLGLGEDPHLAFAVNSLIGTFNDATAIKQLVSATLKSVIKKRFVFPNGHIFSVDKDLRIIKRRFNNGNNSNGNSNRASLQNSSSFGSGSLLNSSNNSLMTIPSNSNQAAPTAAQPDSNPFKGIKLNLQDIISVGTKAQMQSAKGDFLVIEATNLPVTDDNGCSDPYCMIKVGRTIKKTSVQFKDLNPKWNEEFTFIVYDLTKDMEIKIYDRDLVKDDYVGVVNLSLSSICNPKSTVELNEPIKVLKKYSNRPNPNSTLSIKFRWEPYEAEQPISPIDLNEHWIEDDCTAAASVVTNGFVSGEDIADMDQQGYEEPNVTNAAISGSYALGITLTEAQDLCKICDPFCVIESDQITSHSTKTIKRTRNPKWNETFAFQIFQPNGKVTFKIYDWNRFTQNDLIAEAHISLEDVFRDVKQQSSTKHVLTLKGKENESVAGILKINLNAANLGTDKAFDEWYAEFFEGSWSSYLKKNGSASRINSMEEINHSGNAISNRQART